MKGLTDIMVESSVKYNNNCLILKKSSCVNHVRTYVVSITCGGTWIL